MTHNGEDFLGAQRLAGTNDVFNKRTATRAVQHFGAVRPQPRPFPRSQDDDGEIEGRHKQLILRHLPAFDNSGLYRKAPRHKNAVDSTLLCPDIMKQVILLGLWRTTNGLLPHVRK
jgi:hypothetical protein